MLPYYVTWFSCNNFYSSPSLPPFNFPPPLCLCLPPYPSPSFLPPSPLFPLSLSSVSATCSSTTETRVSSWSSPLWPQSTWDSSSSLSSPTSSSAHLSILASIPEVNNPLVSYFYMGVCTCHLKGCEHCNSIADNVPSYFSAVCRHKAVKH